MQPDLAAPTDRPAGPQMFADFPGERSTGPFDPGTTFAAYHGAPPDYVYGSDWKRLAGWRPQAAAENPAAPADDAVAPADAAVADAADTAPVRPADDAPALQPVSYPTTDRDAAPDNPGV